MPDNYHMSAESFREHGHVLIDWLADHLNSIESREVMPSVEPGEIRARLPADPPEQPEPFSAILQDLDEIVMPGVTHWQSPRWFAYFPANSSPPAILGELVAAGLGVQGMMWSTSPACTELESHVLDWLVDLMGVPQTWKTSVGPGGGVLQMSASDSTHAALVSARHRATTNGARADRLVVYYSSQCHSSGEKGARIAGYQHTRTIEIDHQLAMKPKALAATVARDLEAGLLPTIVLSTIGTTGTTAVDPVRAIGEIAREHGMWHHLDAAYAGTAMICPEMRHHQDGLELVDSYTWNPHKWMFTNFDCNVYWVADRAPLLHVMGINPAYLENAASASGRVIDYRDWHLPLGRRFRALKLWFVLRSYGAEGLRYHVREHLRLAQLLAERVREDPRLELVAPAPFGLVCFRHQSGDAATFALGEAVNASGRFAITPSKLPDGSDFIRISVGQTHTLQPHVEELWQIIQENL